MQKKVFVPILVVAFFLLSTSIPTQGADATAASIEMSSNTYLAGTPVTIRVYSITAAGSYFRIYFMYDAAGTQTLEAKGEFANISVTLGSSDTEFSLTRIFPSPTAGDTITVHVTNAAETALANTVIVHQELDDVFPTDFFIELGVALMIVLIIVGIVVGLAIKGKRKYG